MSSSGGESETDSDDEYERLPEEESYSYIESTIINNRIDYLHDLNMFVNSGIDSVIPIVINERNIFRYINMLPRDEQEIIQNLFERREGETLDEYYDSYSSTTGGAS